MALKTQAANRKDLNTGKADLQHRHFATIATILRAMPLDRRMSPAQVAEHFADELRATNPKFDRARFLAACKTEG